MENTLFIIGGIAAVLVLGVVGVLAAVRAFYKVPLADEALVKTGGKSPVVSTGGGQWVIPMFHRVARVSLQAIRVPIVRTGEDAVPSQDMIPAEIKGEMFVQINPQDDKAIVLAVQSLGTSDPNKMAALVREKIDSQVTDALRTAAFQKTFLELNSEKKQFADAVVELMQDDLAKLGLTLTAVSVTHVTQGTFTSDAGDVIAAQGRRNVAETVERNREETNKITREAEIKIQGQNVEAREQALALEFRQAQKEADNARAVAEYEAQQRVETEKAVLLQNQAEEEAKASQARAVAEAQAAETEKTEKARIAQQEAVAIRRAEANAAQKEADEKAAIRIATAEAERQVADEQAERQKEEALIAKNKAVEAARIEKEQAIKVADEQRQQAVAEAEVAREQAVALKRAQEAEARATQATAEAKQREAEEQVVTVKAKAEAERQKAIVTIQAEESAAQEKIKADQEAYVEAKKAEGERDAALKTAEATKARAEGEAQAEKARAQGQADAKTLAAEAYATDLTTRAQAEFDAASKQAESRTLLANAALEEGKAEAESRRLLVEAENAVATELLIRDVAVAVVNQAPSVVRELMQPISAVTHDVKVLQVNGLGGTDGGSESTASTILGTGMALTGALPVIKQAVSEFVNNDEVKAIASDVTGIATSAIREGVRAAAAPENGASA